MPLLLPIGSVDPRFRRHTATAGQTALAVPFPFQDNADISAYLESDGTLTLLEETTDYTLTGAGEEDGGTLTLTSGAAEGAIYVIVGAAVLTRTSSIAQGGKFRSERVDSDLTRLVIVAQELSREIGRAIRTAYGATAPTLTVGEADALLAFDDAGNIVPGPVWDEDLGIPGRSAYEVAVANGFSGSEAAWLLSLKGETGAPGANGTGAGDMLAANNLSDVEEVETARENLGLVVGTDVQAYSARLADIVTIGTPAADRLLMWDQSAGAWKAMTPAAGLVVSGTELRALETVCIPLSDETTAIATGTAKGSIALPYAFELVGVAASLNTVSSSGTPTFDINVNGSTILSTKIVIDVDEKTGGSAGYQGTAAAAAVLSATTLAAGDQVTGDIDAAGTGAKGAKLYLIGYRPGP